jgi:hypothetical protein
MPNMNQGLELCCGFESVTVIPAIYGNLFHVKQGNLLKYGHGRS